MKRLAASTAYVTFAISSFGLAACSGALQSTPPSSAQTTARISAPLTASETPTPIPFKFQTIDHPGTKFTEVTGINQLGKIVGIWKAGEGGLVESFFSEPPYTKFRNVAVAGAKGTYLMGLDNTRDAVGYVVDPPDLTGRWALVLSKTLYWYKAPHEGSGSDAVFELLGMDDARTAVGFYVDPSGLDVPVTSNIDTESVMKMGLPSGATGAEATGISGKGDVSGFETTPNVAGFYLQGVYYAVAYPGAMSTQALGVNFQKQVCGSYQDYASGHIHGFVLSGPTQGASGQVWQSIDEPNASGTTVVTNINDHQEISGYYVDAQHVTHGFVATP